MPAWWLAARPVFLRVDKEGPTSKKAFCKDLEELRGEPCGYSEESIAGRKGEKRTGHAQ